MKILDFKVNNFRNVAHAHMVPGTGLNFLTGPNGQGKTNLLEALFGTLRGKSFRSYATKNDWVPTPGGEVTDVQVQLEDSYGIDMECRLAKGATGRWEFWYNGKKTTPGKIRERVPVVVFSPDDHALIRSGPDLRRDYMDEVFTDVAPGYADVLDRFEKSLKNRNRLLKLNLEAPAPTAELRTWTRLLAETSTDLAQLRWDIWRDFDKRFRQIGRELFSELGEGLALEFRPDLGPPASGSYTIELFEAHVLSSFEKDMATGWSHRGPQRDDFGMAIKGVDSRAGASQGQARLLALLLKWVHADWVRTERRQLPLFLIDDFSSELDAERRRRLLNLVQALKGQIFVTGTDPAMVDSTVFCDYTQYVVREGVLSPAQNNGNAPKT